MYFPAAHKKPLRDVEKCGKSILFGQEPFGLQRRHAAHSGGCHGLSVDVVGDVAGGENAGLASTHFLFLAAVAQHLTAPADDEHTQKALDYLERAIDKGLKLAKHGGDFVFRQIANHPRYKTLRRKAVAQSALFDELPIDAPVPLNQKPSVR